MDPSQITALLTAWDSRAYVVFAALGVNVLLAAIKGGWLGTWIATRIPARYLPLGAVLVSALSVGVGELAGGQRWQHALLSTLFTAAGAVTTHQTVVESLRGGRELVPQTSQMATRRAANNDPKKGCSNMALENIVYDGQTLQVFRDLGNGRCVAFLDGLALFFVRDPADGTWANSQAATDEERAAVRDAQGDNLGKTTVVVLPPDSAA